MPKLMPILRNWHQFRILLINRTYREIFEVSSIVPGSCLYLSSAKMTTIFGLLFFSAHTPLFTADNSSMAGKRTRKRVAILCRTCARKCLSLSGWMRVLVCMVIVRRGLERWCNELPVSTLSPARSTVGRRFRWGVKK
jgi:hypothetical protein